MSAHSYGGGNEPPRHQKAETIRLGLLSDVRNPDILKPNKQVNLKGSMTGVRSIAPSPGLSASQVQHPLAVSATQLLGGSTVQSNISSKLASAIGLGSGATQIGGGDHQQPTSMNLASNQASSGTSVAQIRTINSQQQNMIQAAVLQSQNIVKVPMASIVRSGNPGVQNPHQLQQSQAVNPIHQFATHIPRGPAAVSQLTANKGSVVATPMLRPNQPMGSNPRPLQQLPCVGGSMVPGVGQASALQQQRAALLPVRGHTPPSTRAASPAVHQLHADAAQKSGGVPVPTTIQISVQQQRNTVEVHTRPIQQLGVGKTQLTSQHNQMTHTQKVIMSQSGVTPMSQGGVTPMMQTGSIQTPLTIAGQKIVNPNTGMLINPMRQPKVIATQPAQLANVPGQGNATAYALGGTRTSKIIVTQAINPHNPGAGTIISTIPRTTSLGTTISRQHQKMMSHPVNTIAAMTTTVTTMTSKGVAHISLHGHQQSTTVNSMTTSTPIAKIPPQRPAPTVMASHQTNLAHLQQQHHTQLQTSLQQHQAEAAHAALRVSTATAVTHHHHQPAPHYVQNPQVGTAVSVAGMYMNKTSGGVMVSQHQTLPTHIQTQQNIQAQQTGLAEVARSQDSVRLNNFPMLNIPAEVLNNPALSSIYQQAMAANNLRPMVSGQSSNLTATLQGSGHGTSVTVTGTHTQPSLRVNNNSNAVMVTVDPTRHNIHNTHHSLDAKGLKQEVVATMASSHLNAASAAALNSGHSIVGAPPPQPAPGGGGQPVTSSLTASPRPSILRKRNCEGLPLVKRQILGGPPPSEHSNSSSSHDLSSAGLPASAISPKPSTLDAVNENSQSSTDTASSTQSTPHSKRAAGAGMVPGDKNKPEHPVDGATLENGHIGSIINSSEASPRKRPRKQLLPPATEEVKEAITDTDAEEEIQKFSEKVYSSRELEKQQQEEAEKEEVSEFVDEDGVRWVRDKKRPPIALLNHYQCSWKPKNNHFLRHSDVKPKEERRPTVNELANQKHIVQKSSGWKLYHLAAQIEELMDAERLVLDKMILVQDQVAPKHIAKTTMEDDIGMVHELSQGNIQRSQLFADQMQEARTALVKILDHKKRIGEIVTKHHSKRPVKKKER